MEAYINSVLEYYSLEEKYIVEQEYDPDKNIYSISIYSSDINSNRSGYKNPVNNSLIPINKFDKRLPEILRDNHDEFILNLDKIITQVYPDYLRSSLKINYFDNKIWIDFIPVILHLHVITPNAKISKNEYKLKNLVISINEAARNKFAIHHHIFYDTKRNKIKRFKVRSSRYSIDWNKADSGDSIKELMDKLGLLENEVIVIVPMDYIVEKFPVELYDVYNNDTNQLDNPDGTVYAIKYKHI